MPLPPALLAELPPEVAATVDLGEFGPQLPEAEALAARIGAHLVTYRPGPSPPPRSGRRHLCATLTMASLTTEQQERVRELERIREVVLVAYARPVQVRGAHDDPTAPI